MENETVAKRANQKELIRKLIANLTAISWVCLVFGVMAGGYGFVVWHGEPSSLNNLGAFGSYLQGAVQSLWSLAGLLFIYVAFLGQKQQLIYQQEQIEDQKKQFETQLKGQEAEMQSQQKQFQLEQDSIKRQTFESSFFQLLNLHVQNVEAIKWGGYHGKGYFEMLSQRFPNDFPDFLQRRNGGHTPTPQERQERSNVIEFFEKYYREKETHMGPYFKTLEHLLRFIDERNIEPKREYTSLVQAQLSQCELLFLFYYGLRPRAKQLKEYIEKYGLFRLFEESMLLEKTHLSFYEEGSRI